jgi:hypothetical protein
MKKLLLFLMFIPSVVFAGVIGETETGTIGLDAYDGYTYAIPVVLPVTGTITKLSAYLQNSTGTVNGRMFLFAEDDVTGLATTLLSSSTMVGVTTTPGWVDFAIETPLTLGASTYWIGFSPENIGIMVGRFYKTAITTRTNYYTSVHYSNPQNYIYDASYGGMSLALQATYTVGGSTDTTAPVVSNWSPAKSSTGNSRLVNISFNVADVGLGVALTSTTVTVEGSVVYDGHDAGSYPNMSVSGTSANYAFTYNSSDFAYDQVVDVVITGQDLAPTPNTFSDSYNFTIEATPAPPSIGSAGSGGCRIE